MIADVVSSSTGWVSLSVADHDRVDVGYLPCDVNQNRQCEPFDLLVFRQLVSGVWPATKAWDGEYLPGQP